MSTRIRVSIGMVGILLIASACSGATPTPTSTSTPASTSTSGPAAAPTATASLAPGPGSVPIDAGLHAAHVMGTGGYPGYTVVVPSGWFDYLGGGRFVIKYPTTDQPSPVVGLSVWDVAQVFQDPCHWQGQEVDPGPTVDDLVAALTAQKLRNATKPTDVTLAGYAGKYLQLSVPADLKSSTWTDFDACDLADDGHRNFESWLGNGMGNRYEQVPGQVDRVWVLDVMGQRLVVDATYSPDTTQEDRTQLEQIVTSLRFVAPKPPSPSPTG